MTCFMYVPFADAGFSFIIISTKASGLPASASTSKDNLPIGAWTYARLIDTELNSTRLHLADGLRHVKGHGTDLWIRHETTWPEDATNPADQTHHVGRRDRLVEIQPALVLDL